MHTFIESLLDSIEFDVHEDNLPITNIVIPEKLCLIGTGTDAVVVQDPSDPTTVYKVFHSNRVQKKKNEAMAYQQIGDSVYFPKIYGEGEHYLKISYEDGPTLLECLEQGIEIPQQILIDVETAMDYARSRGLNPRDIHLKNVVNQQGRAKLLDLSEYILPGNDYRWEHLVQGYQLFYPLIRGKKIPAWIIDSVKRMYVRQASESFSVQDFGKKIARLFY